MTVVKTQRCGCALYSCILWEDPKWGGEGRSFASMSVALTAKSGVSFLCCHENAGVSELISSISMSHRQFYVLRESGALNDRSRRKGVETIAEKQN